MSHLKQKIKVKKTFSNWTNIPQGSILGALVFNNPPFKRILKGGFLITVLADYVKHIFNV